MFHFYLFDTFFQQISCAFFFIAISVASSRFPFSTAGNGVNLQPSYYNGGNVSFGWTLMKRHSRIKMVRIEIEPELVHISLAASWIREAVENGYAVIATYHKHTLLGSNNPGKCRLYWRACFVVFFEGRGETYRDMGKALWVELEWTPWTK